MKRKLFAVLPITAAMVVLGACSADPPVAPTVTDTVALPPSTQTVTQPAPPPVTQTEMPPTATRTVTPRPTETANPITGCVERGMNTSHWNTLMDVPSEDELRLEPEHQGQHFQPSVDAPLIDVRAWSGTCFDTAEFVIDTTMNEEGHYDRPWFNVAYEQEGVKTLGQGAVVPLDGDADLRVTFYAKAASFVHWSGHVPSGLVNASNFYRDMGSSFATITEIAGLGEHENVVSFGIGVDRERAFAAHFTDNQDGTTSVVVRVAR